MSAVHELLVVVVVYAFEVAASSYYACVVPGDFVVTAHGAVIHHRFRALAMDGRWQPK